MNNTSRPQPRRGPSGAWSRLRTTAVDALEVYGLPSKGDARLSDPKTQEAYFETIVSRYMKFCASCGSGEKLDEAFALLSIGPNSSAPLPRPSSTIRKRETDLSSASSSSKSEESLSQNSNQSSAPIRPSQSVIQSTSKAPSQPSTLPSSSWQPPPNELPTLLMAMRKLREGIVSQKRTDAFAQRVYIFICRTTIHPFRHFESYHPSLLYLLHHIHPKTPLTASELQEFASYLILDLACRQGDLHQAFRTRRRYRVRDWKVDRALKSMVSDDWIAFWRVRRQVDGGMRVLLGWAEQDMRRHALAVLGRAYLSADREFVETCADREWSVLVEEDRVGWILEGNGNVTIRKIKAK